MRLTCPVCNFVESRAHRAWRLEVCPRCRDEGREVYLADAAERPPGPGRETTRVRSDDRTRAARLHLSLPVPPSS